MLVLLVDKQTVTLSKTKGITAKNDSRPTISFSVPDNKIEDRPARNK